MEVACAGGAIDRNLAGLLLRAAPALQREAAWLHGCLHRELICMHSGIVNRNRSPGPRALVLSIQPLPGQTVCGCKSLDTSGFCRRKPFGQAVAGSIGPAPAVRGVKFRSLVRGGGTRGGGGGGGGGGGARRATAVGPLQLYE
jgi:hypothetical protein